MFINKSVRKNYDSHSFGEIKLENHKIFIWSLTKQIGQFDGTDFLLRIDVRISLVEHGCFEQQTVLKHKSVVVTVRHDSCKRCVFERSVCSRNVPLPFRSDWRAASKSLLFRLPWDRLWKTRTWSSLCNADRRPTGEQKKENEKRPKLLWRRTSCIYVTLSRTHVYRQRVYPGRDLDDRRGDGEEQDEKRRGAAPVVHGRGDRFTCKKKKARGTQVPVFSFTTW